MKSWMQLLLTAVIVAGGLFVYDTLRVRTESEHLREAAARESEPQDRATGVTPEPAPFVVLEGTGDDLWRDDVERRLQELAQILARQIPRGSSVGGDGIVKTDGRHADSTDGASAEEVGDVVEAPGADGARDRSREQLRQFRGMMEAVERQRRREQAAKKVHTFFQGLDLQLTDDQMRDVVRTTLTYQDKWRRETKAIREGEPRDGEREAAVQRLLGEYESALHDVVPSAEVDRIMTGVRNATSGNRDARN